MAVHDVSRAYFHAKPGAPVFARLPSEDAEDGMRGELLSSMCGATHAASTCQYGARDFMG